MPFVTSKDGTQIGYSVTGAGPGTDPRRRRDVLARIGPAGRWPNS